MDVSSKFEDINKSLSKLNDFKIMENVCSELRDLKYSIMNLTSEILKKNKNTEK